MDRRRVGRPFCLVVLTDRPTDGVLARRRTILVKFIIKRSNCASRIAAAEGEGSMEDKQTRTAAAQKASIASFKDAGKADVAVEGWRANGRGRWAQVRRRRRCLRVRAQNWRFPAKCSTK